MPTTYCVNPACREDSVPQRRCFCTACWWAVPGPERHQVLMAHAKARGPSGGVSFLPTFAEARLRHTERLFVAEQAMRRNAES